MTDQELDLGVGTQAKVTLSPKKVIVKDVKIEPKYKKNSTTLAGKLVEVYVKHPDKPEDIIISKIKTLSSDKLKVESLWLNTDSEGKIQKGTPVAKLLASANAASLRDLIQRELDTVTESEQVSYLVLKAY